VLESVGYNKACLPSSAIEISLAKDEQGRSPQMSAASSRTIARTAAIAAAALCLAGIDIANAAAQSSGANAGSQGTGLQGTGPRVDVQTSPNGTLDVSGAGATDLNMTGENFRGSFGASRSQPGWSVVPNLPRSSIQVPFAAPNFNPSMPSPSAERDGNTRQTDEADLAAYPDLILPRFRSALSGGTSFGAGTSSLQRQRGALPPASARADAWRYRYSGGRWWFWQPSETWLYWDGARWQAFAPRP